MRERRIPKNVRLERGEKESLKKLIALILPVFARHWKRLLIGFVGLLLVDAFQLLVPRVTRTVIDGLEMGKADDHFLLRLGLVIIAMGIAIAILRYIWRTSILGFSRLLENDIRNRLFVHILKMDSAFFERRTTGQIMAHTSNDLAAVQMACGIGIAAAVDAIIMSIAAILFMMAIDLKMTLLALLPMPLLALSTQLLASKMHTKFNLVQEQFGNLTEFARSTLVSMRLIKGYTMERAQTERFDRMGRAYVKSNLKVAVIQGLLQPVASLVGNLGMLLVLYLGGVQVIREVISMGDFVAFISYLYMLVWPMMAVGWVVNLVQRGLTSLTRIHNMFEEKPLLTDGGDAEFPGDKVEEIRLQNLDFSYPGKDTVVLKNLHLAIGPGITGVTGPTGGGKSTLCKILARLYPVADKTFLLNGQDVNSLAVDRSRNLVSYVGQEPFLFSDTIRNNIIFGCPDCDDEKMIHCARLAGVHDDITAFSEGYDSLVGERGVTLSGGQRQRVTLARALLRDANILIIDDGLSSVDVKTEQQVIKGLQQHLVGKVVIMISHRIKLLSRADRIIIIDEGKITHEGTHQELLESSSFYAAMHEKQSRDSLREGEEMA